MVKLVNLNRDLDAVVMLEDRGEHTTEEQARASFAKLHDFRDGGIFVAHFSGCSGWEVHSKGDEIVHVLEGATRFDIIVDDELQTHELEAGSLLVVPRGCWHRFTSETGVKVLTATPQPTQHTHVDDPRMLATQ